MKIPFFASLVVSFLLPIFALAAGPAYQNGDFIFHTSGSPQSKAIQKASKSPFSHVGIVEVTPTGQLFVIEAISTVSRTPMHKWLGRAIGGKYAVFRYSGFRDRQGENLVAAARKYEDRAYDIHFTSHNEDIYCSELVDLAAKDIGITVGHYQRLEELDVNNPLVKGLIEDRWESHPLCRGMGSFDTCWNKIMKDTMITPVALSRDRQVKQVWSNY